MKNTFKLPLFPIELTIAYLFFSKSRISDNNFSSAVGSGSGAGAAGSSFFFCDNLLMAFTSKNTQKAIMIKLKTLRFACAPHPVVVPRAIESLGR